MIETAFAAAIQSASSPAGGAFSQFIPIILMFVIFYFLLIRPQQKKAKAHKLLIEGLKKDDKVITSSGIVGMIVSADNEFLTLEIAERVRIKILRANITEKIDQNKQPQPPAKDGKKD